MKTNLEEIKPILFNPCKVNFMPKFELDGAELELVEEVKLLGVILRSDMSWTSNTDYMVQRATSKLKET